MEFRIKEIRTVEAMDTHRRLSDCCDILLRSYQRGRSKKCTKGYLTTTATK